MAAPRGEHRSFRQRVAYGPGALRRLPELVGELGARACCLVTSRSLVERTPLVASVTELLGTRLAGEPRTISAHTPRSEVEATAAWCREAGVGGLVALGGGSAIDAAKAIAVELADGPGGTAPLLPFAAVPTTLSAAEFSHLVGVTDDASRLKLGFADARAVPAAVVMDPEATRHTPDWLWLGSGIRALDHAVEQVCSADAEPVTDVTALAAIELLFQRLPASRDEGAIEDRGWCQVAAYLSFLGVETVSVGLSHRLGRRVGASYGVPHGVTSAILLAPVLRVTLAATREAQGRVARAAGRAEPEEAADAVAGLVAELGLPQRLRDVGVPEADLELISGGDEAALEALRLAW